jgi:TRAP-type C4-dicarboxylate transport system substrate-binding protein
MNKLNDALAVLRKLSPEEQELAAEAILDYAERNSDLRLTDEQAEDVRRRLRDEGEETLTPAEARRMILGS